MNTLQAILYGAIQGLTEYLPVSSSAHLILLPRFLGTEEPGLAFDVFLHLGTLASTLLFFWKDWLQLFSVFWLGKKAPPEAKRLLMWVVIATIPALLAGALLHHWVSTVLRGNAVLMVTLVVGAVVLIGADRLAPIRKTISTLTARDALGVGLFQCLALMPGMSRSGSTITGGRILGLDRVSATRFSFLLSAPITAAALVFELKNWSQVVESQIGVVPMLAGMASAFVFGWLAIGGLLRWVNRGGLLPLAVYRVILAITIFFVLGP